MKVGVFDSNLNRRDRILKTVAELHGGRYGPGGIEAVLLSLDGVSRDPAKLDKCYLSHTRFTAVFVHESDVKEYWQDVEHLECFENATIVRYSKGASKATSLRRKYYHIQRSVTEAGLTSIECGRMLDWVFKGARDEKLPEDLYSTPVFEYINSVLILSRAYLAVEARLESGRGVWDKHFEKFCAAKWWLDALHSSKDDLVLGLATDWETVPLPSSHTGSYKAAIECVVGASPYVLKKDVEALVVMLQTRMDQYGRIS